MWVPGLLCILAALDLVKTARILCIFPVPFLSHQLLLRRLTEELVKQGHQLVVMTPMPQNKPMENVTEIDVHDVSFPLLDKALENVLTRQMTTYEERIFWTNLISKISMANLKSPGIQRLMHDESQDFDLILSEDRELVSILACTKFKAPIAIVSVMTTSSYNFKLVGADVNPIYFPDHKVKKTIFEPSFFSRISLILEHSKALLSDFSLTNMFENSIKINLDKILPPMSIKATLEKYVKMVLVNVHPVWDDNRPVPPAVIFLEGLHTMKASPLPRDLDRYLNNSAHGVIYMGLGSKHRPSQLPASTIQLLLRVFASLPYDILWKWDGEDLQNKSKNIRLEKRLPQKDLLYHPKVKAFITHCGLLSTEEAIAAKVPLIGIPVLSELWRNSHQYMKFGIGVQLNLFQLNEDEFRKAIIDVAENKRYRENIRRLSLVIRERGRRGSLPNAARALVRLTIHGAHLLHQPLADITFMEFYLLDLLTVATCISLALTAILVYSLRRANRWVRILKERKQSITPLSLKP